MQVENHKEEVPFSHYEALFQAADASEIAARTGAKWDGKEFYVNLLGTQYAVAHPKYGIRICQEDPTPVSCADTPSREGVLGEQIATACDASLAMTSQPSASQTPSPQGERGERRRGGYSDLSEWPGSVCNAAAPSARRTPGTPTGEGLGGVQEAVSLPGAVRSSNDTQRVAERIVSGHCPLPIIVQTFLLRFLLEGKAVAHQGVWKTFREMPWGELYIKPYTGRVLTRAAFTFGTRLANFKAACEKLGATPVGHGDAGYEFAFLGSYRMQVLVWEGDDEFPPNAQILYSDNFQEGFGAEDRVVAGDILISVIKSKM